MGVQIEALGRRSVQVAIQVPGTADEVWQAIATGPGLTAWFVPATFEARDGQPVAVTMDFGGGMTSTSTITAWQEPHNWGAEAGWPAFLRTLRLYLTHFRGLQPSLMKWMVPAPGSEAEAWASLSEALAGLEALRVGQRWTAPAGAPPLSGVVAYVSEAPYDVLLRLDQPGPGVAAFGAVNFGGQSLVALSVNLYGDTALDTAAQQIPLWESWFRVHFPAPPEDA